MTVHVVSVADIAAQPWRNGGGVTRPLLSWPTAKGRVASEASPKGPSPIPGKGRVASEASPKGPSPIPADDWMVRISVADIEQSGPFSSFPDKQRFIVVLTGSGITLGPPLNAVVTPGDDPLEWPGHVAPHCTLIDGATTDLNAMFDARHGYGWLRTLSGAHPATSAANGAALRGNTAGALRACAARHSTLRGVFTQHALAVRTGSSSIEVLDASLVWSDDDQSDWLITDAGTSSTGQAWSFQYTLHDVMNGERA